jgi:hypothetical protein
MFSVLLGEGSLPGRVPPARDPIPTAPTPQSPWGSGAARPHPSITRDARTHTDTAAPRDRHERSPAPRPSSPCARRTTTRLTDDTRGRPLTQHERGPAVHLAHLADSCTQHATPDQRGRATKAPKLALAGPGVGGRDRGDIAFIVARPREVPERHSPNKAKIAERGTGAGDRAHSSSRVVLPAPVPIPTPDSSTLGETRCGPKRSTIPRSLIPLLHSRRLWAHIAPARPAGPALLDPTRQPAAQSVTHATRGRLHLSLPARRPLRALLTSVGCGRRASPP